MTFCLWRCFEQNLSLFSSCKTFCLLKTLIWFPFHLWTHLRCNSISLSAKAPFFFSQKAFNIFFLSFGKKIFSKLNCKCQTATVSHQKSVSPTNLLLVKLTSHIQLLCRMRNSSLLLLLYFSNMTNKISSESISDHLTLIFPENVHCKRRSPDFWLLIQEVRNSDQEVGLQDS